MKQQTAVEWLVDNLPQRFKNAMLISGKEIIEQAKQMEKEQIINAFIDGDYAYFHSKETGRDFDNGEQYYNETFGGNNEQ